MCIIIATKRNVTSVFQIKAATKTITKDSDRMGEKLKLCGIRGTNSAAEKVDCAVFTVQFQEKKILVEVGEWYVCFDQWSLHNNASYRSFNDESLQSLAGKVCPLVVWSHQTTVCFCNLWNFTVKCQWRVLRSQRINPIRTEELCGSI